MNLVYLKLQEVLKNNWRETCWDNSVRMGIQWKNYFFLISVTIWILDLGWRLGLTDNFLYLIINQLNRETFSRYNILVLMCLPKFGRKCVFLNTCPFPDVRVFS